MTTEEKLKYFEESSLEEARKQASAMIEEYKVNLDKVEKEHKATTLRQSDLQLKTESDNLKRNNNMALSKEQLQIKRKITQKQNELKEKLFVKQLLEDYMTTSAYQQLLIKQIKNIQKEAGSGKLILYIDPADSDKRSSLQVATGAPVTVSEYSFMGGTRAVLQDRNILIDNSFASKLEKLKADFSFNGGATNA